jgi:asparagine synthase (glutamine-hydrolysing)
MCGIAAMFARRGEVQPDALERARGALAHRGPDEQGLWLSSDRRVGLAHARLSIIDLVTGQQPISNEDGSVWAIVNGELYDYEQTQRELEARGHRLRSRSDSEILVHLYEEFGAHAVHHLKGEYAFVLWDEKRRTLLAARDRFGIKPLVYAQHHDRLYIASEAKALFAAGVPARWDRESLVLSCFVSPPDRTLFEGVFSLPPGGMLRATEHSFSVSSYWDLEFPRAGTIEISESDAVANVRTLLDRSVRRRLRADVPVGIYLSGGLDSCALLGIAATHGQTLTGFTISFDRDPQPEEQRAREMAAHVGAPLNVMPVTQQMLADHFPAAVRAAETMMINGHGVAKFLLSRFARDRGHKVVLTGEGADEMFAGYPAMREDRLRELGAGSAAAAQLRSGNSASLGYSVPLRPSTSPRLDVVRTLLGSSPAFLEAFAETGDSLLSLFDDAIRPRLAHTNPFLTLLESVDIPSKLAGRDAVQRSLYLLRLTMLPTYMLTVLGDRMEMAHSIEGRVPFLDHELAEYVARIPTEMKIGQVEKKVLRDAVRDLLPPAICERPKHPLQAPIDTQGPMWQMLQDTLRSDVVKRIPHFDPAKVAELADLSPDTLQAPGQLNRHALALTRIASLCALQEAFQPG